MGFDMVYAILAPPAPSPAIPASLHNVSQGPVPCAEDVPALVPSTSASVASSVASSEADDDLPELGDDQDEVLEDEETMEDAEGEEDPVSRHSRAKEAAAILLSQMLEPSNSSETATPSWEYRSRWATPKALSYHHLSRLGLEPLQLMLNVRVCQSTCQFRLLMLGFESADTAIDHCSAEQSDISVLLGR